MEQRTKGRTILRESQVQSMRFLDLEERSRDKIDPRLFVLTLILEYATYLLHRLEVGNDRKTVHGRGSISSQSHRGRLIVVGLGVGEGNRSSNDCNASTL